MQVQYYHPVGHHLLYHYAAAVPPNGLPASQAPPQQHHLPPPPHPYFAFPLLFHQQLQQQQQQQQHQSPGSSAAAAAFFAQQQQQQLVGLALHFQSLSVNSSNGRSSSSSSSNSSCSNNINNSVNGQVDINRLRSASFGQPDYQWKLLVWLKTHRMHKYFDRLRKYSFEQLINLDRDTLEAEQFTQGAIKKLLGMLERVRADRGTFESPTRTTGGVGSIQLQRQQSQQPRQPLVFPPTLSQPPPHHYDQQQQQQQQANLVQYRRKFVICP